MATGVAMFCRRSPGHILGMALAPPIALCAASPIDETGDGAPDWLHLLPEGAVRTNDGRGPYRVPDAAALMAASLTTGSKLVLDENHSTDLAAPKGLPAPARGWIVGLEHRSDGIWGQVEWTDEGRRLAAAREYSGVSPVISYRKDGTILAILRASLTNQPNLQGLTSLHQEEYMDLRALLIEALGLDGAADDAAIIAAVKAGKEAKAEGDPVALQAALAPIARIVGLGDDADGAAVLAGVERLRAGASTDDVVVGLQAELAGVAIKLNTLTDEAKRTAATTFVDGAIAAGRVGVKPMRDEYIAMHMEGSARVEKLIGAMPVIRGGSTTANRDAEPSINDDPVLIAQHAATYQAKLAKDGISIDFATAVRGVMEGKAK